MRLDPLRNIVTVVVATDKHPLVWDRIAAQLADDIPGSPFAGAIAGFELETHGSLAADQALKVLALFFATEIPGMIASRLSAILPVAGPRPS